MPTENTYQSIPLYEKIEIEYLAWQITRMQAVPGIYRAKERTSVSGGRTWKDGSREFRLTTLQSDRAKSSTGWKTCISAPRIHTTIK